jgi:hypothetical protein
MKKHYSYSGTVAEVIVEMTKDETALMENIRRLGRITNWSLVGMWLATAGIVVTAWFGPYSWEWGVSWFFWGMFATYTVVRQIQRAKMLGCVTQIQNCIAQLSSVRTVGDPEVEVNLDYIGFWTKLKRKIRHREVTSA